MSDPVSNETSDWPIQAFLFKKICILDLGQSYELTSKFSSKSLTLMYNNVLTVKKKNLQSVSLRSALSIKKDREIFF